MQFIAAPILAAATSMLAAGGAEGLFNLLKRLSENLWIIAAVVILASLLIGFRDVVRLSWRRIWAIASVCVSESIRRRVLWIPPLAILGVIIVSQLSHPTDAQDAIRQTTKFFLFASGLVVTVTIIILACSNLPKEIESRVIYTIVTKPTTRLEIVIGKVTGFACVAGMILLFMGAFTMGYLLLRSHQLTNEIVERLNTGNVEDIARPGLEHQRDVGLLNARALTEPNSLQVYAREPVPAEKRRWISGESEMEIIVPFHVTTADLQPDDPSISPGGSGLLITVSIGYEMRKAAAAQTTSQPTTKEAGGFDVPIPFLRPEDQKLPIPAISVAILDKDQYNLIDFTQILDTRQIKPGQKFPEKGEAMALEPIGPDGKVTVMGFLKPEFASKILDRSNDFYININGPSPGYQYFVDDNPVTLSVPGINQPIVRTISAAGPAQFRGRTGTYGFQLKGVADATTAPVAVFHYKDARIAANDAGRVPMEFRTGIERSSSDPTESDVPTIMQLTVRNTASGMVSEPILLSIENNRTSFFDVQAAAVAGGEFDVMIRCLTNEHWVGLRPMSLGLVSKSEPFVFNLIKSLFIMWLMAILVITISIFCSTFLSWPTAIVLTIVILLGRWGVDQLGDAAAPGIGNRTAQDMNFKDPAAMKAISASVEALTSVLSTASRFGPDISQFSATEDIERGVTIPMSKIMTALMIVGGFGVSMMMLSYMRLRWTEVAP